MTRSYPDNPRLIRASGGSLRRLVLLVALAGVGAPLQPLISPPCDPSVARAQEPVRPEDERFVVIRAGKVITVAGEELRDAVIVLAGGKIHNIGADLEYPLNAMLIDAHDRVVMPGLINPSSRFGLSSYSRGDVHGNWSAAEEYAPVPDAYRELLDAGYTAIALVPAGSGVPGRAIVVRTGGPLEQRVLLSPAYLRAAADKKVLRGAFEKAQQEIDKVDRARQEFEKKQEQEKKAATQPGSQPATTQAVASQPAFQPPPIEATHQVLVDLIQKKPGVTVLVELNNASDLLHVSDVLKRFDVAHHFLLRNAQQADFDYVVATLGERKAKVIVQPALNRAPYSAERLNLPRALSEAGCEVSANPLADTAGEHRRMLSRLAVLVREGWPRAAALKAVTLHPARLLGLDDTLGSIEKGKSADLVFLDADPLDPRARVREVMINGEIVHRVEDVE